MYVANLQQSLLLYQLIHALQCFTYIHTFDFAAHIAYNAGKEVVCMIEKKCRIIVTDFEYRLLVKAMAEFRNQLLEVQKPTEDINELLLKVIDAPNTRRWR